MLVGEREMAVSYVSSSQLNRVNGRYGIQEIVCLINDDHTVPDFDSYGLTSGRMQEGMVGKQHNLSQQNRNRK